MTTVIEIELKSNQDLTEVIREKEEDFGELMSITPIYFIFLKPGAPATSMSNGTSYPAMGIDKYLCVFRK